MAVASLRLDEKAIFAGALAVSLALHLSVYGRWADFLERPGTIAATLGPKVFDVRWLPSPRPQPVPAARPAPAPSKAPQVRPQRRTARQQVAPSRPKPPLEPAPSPRPEPRPEPKPVPPMRPEPPPEPRPLPQEAPRPPSTGFSAPSPPGPVHLPAESRAAVAVTEKPSPAGPGAQAGYLARLLAHIERHKFYPRAARRRALEGEVEVTFEVLAEGRVRALEVRGGARLLRNAARQAVQAAQPLPRPPEATALPYRVRFRMRFALQGR